MDMTTYEVATYAGTTSNGHTDGTGTNALFFGPLCITINSAGTMALVADFGNHLVRRIDVSSRLVTTLAGNVALGVGPPFNFGLSDGIGTNAAFHQPTGIAIDPAGTFAVVGDLGKRGC